MKKYMFSILVTIFVNCGQSTTTETSSIDYRKMDNAMFFSFASVDIIDKNLTVYIYPKFENQALKDITSSIYNSFRLLGYDISDSVNQVITTRPNTNIHRSFFETETIDYKIVEDTVGFEKDVVIMSEPFFIKDSTLLLFTISCTFTDRYYGFFLEKKDDSSKYDIVYLYDWQKDMMFEMKKQ
jgi:hypothetical protein